MSAYSNELNLALFTSEAKPVLLLLLSTPDEVLAEFTSYCCKAPFTTHCPLSFNS